MHVSSWVWVLFALMVLALLAVDLGVFRASRRGPQEVTLRSAAWWSAAWIGLSLVFGLVILVLYGAAPALTYLTAYLLEKSLSVDNIFVFVLIFSELRIPPEQQRRVLYWGVLGALVVRAVLIAGGVFLLRRFHWVVYPFAALVMDRFRFIRAGLATILAFVGVKLLFSGVVEIPTWVSLAVIAAVLTLAVTASVTTTARAA